MKKLSPSLVAVKKIASTVPRSNFDEIDLEKVARLILELGGLINPIIVRRNGMDGYDIVQGDFEYYAAAKAREIDSFKGETIGAFILEPENEELLLEQVKALRTTAITENAGEDKTPQQSSITEKVIENETPQQSFRLEQRLTNIETRLESQINELKAESAREKQVLAQSVKEVENRILQQVSLLVETGLANRINELKSESSSEKPTLVEGIKEVESVTSPPMSLLAALNTLDKFKLSANLKDAGLKPQIIQIILKERDVRPFVSFANVVERVKGLTDKTTIKIIDYWQKYL